MRNMIILLVLLLIGGSAFGQLNENAKMMKQETPEIYQKVKKFAAEDWAHDHEMMVYVINQQADALIELAELSSRSDYDKNIMHDLAIKWSGSNGFDYSMIVYEYKNQLKAKNSY